jgi:uncharacterized protein (TIGR03085 family)
VLFDAVERAELCALLDDLGPAAPTLLAPWTTLDLAAHLVLREHDPVAAPGLVVPGAWGRFAERRRVALEDRGFPALVATVRSGPPRGFFRIGWVRRLANLNEFFVHHEDVRRAAGARPRALPPGEDEQLFRNVTRSRRLLARRLRHATLALEWPATGAVVVTRSGGPVVRLRGQPGELLLYLFGRRAVAEVDVTGPDDAMVALEHTRFGM